TKSLSSNSLSFEGVTSRAEISGSYSGSATSLTVRIHVGTSVGSTASLISFEVTDQDGTNLEEYTGSITAGQVLDIGTTGLKMRFTAGTLSMGNTATTTISAAPTTVSTSAQFNAGWGSAPLFENFQTVAAGSFTINGTTIAVNANDSIASVISRINSSNAGVTAAVNDDKITLTTNSYSEDDIVIGSDTSGFLAATKLSAAVTARGNVRDDQQVFSKTTQFASAASGSFTINGASISVNKDTDSLSSVISRIHSSGAGVTASFNSSTNKLELVSDSASESVIAVSNDTTGFLGIAGLSSGNTVLGHIADDEEIFSRTTQFSAVTNGSFAINGVSISVDIQADSLQSIIGKINTSEAGVTASYDSLTDKFVLTPDTEGGLVLVGSDTSGFLTAAKVTGGVQSGTFTVNSVSIAVANGDTIESVLSKITASAAGVTATYDESTQKVRLAATENSDDPIVVGNDTSGFLALVRLDETASSTPGANPSSAFDAALDDMSEYTSVQSGFLTMNGQQVAVSPGTTTIRGLVSALDALDGVSATLDETGTVRMFSTTGGQAITLSDTSGILSALGIAAGTYEGTPGRVTQAAQESVTRMTNANSVAATVLTAAEKLNEALSQLSRLRGFSPQLRSDLEATIRGTIDSLGKAGASGLSVSTSVGELRVSIDREKLTDALKGTTESLNGVLNSFTDRIAELAAPAAEPASNEISPFQRAELIKAILIRNPQQAQKAVDAYSLGSYEGITALLRSSDGNDSRGNQVRVRY
ncbi:MAG: hypothetical protein HY646_12295, partial [Acidobacteria bacterium]|nr:hypothetical protein [Acidobacteriota bacterium]